MTIAICSIQRNRGQWIKEWIEFHNITGFDKFYIFLHSCTDNSSEIILELSKKYDITAFSLNKDIQRPQLAAYQYCYDNFGDMHDWIAFIDGDEFIFSPQETSIKPILNEFDNYQIGALGVYWSCFGSSHHLIEPFGLITENYRYRPCDTFESNKHIKSIVKGGQKSKFSVSNNSHVFTTSLGTYDTKLRPISSGFTTYSPCYEKLKINHYVTQSYQYFIDFKKFSGAADSNAKMVRSDDWWKYHDRNEIYDTSLEHILPILKNKLIS